MRRTSLFLLTALILLAAPASAEWQMVAWAPGFLGTTEEAQPSMDEFAAAIEAGLDQSLTAIYHPDIDGGKASLTSGAAVVIVPLPVLLEFGEAFKLKPILGVAMEGAEREQWTLVAKKGAIKSPADLSGWTIAGLSGYSPRFMRSAVSDWGDFPADATLEFNTRVLSVLRKAAKGEPVAALLDRAQANAMPRLPFAADLETLAQSPEFPANFVCVVDGRLNDAEAAQFVAALKALDAETLKSIRLVGFHDLEESALQLARKRWNDVAP